MTEILQIIQDFDWSPFWISLKTGIVATIICFFLGIWLARQIIRLGPKSKAILDGILTLPMVVAPTVAGFFLLLLFSLRRPFGSWLYTTFDIKVVQTWLGCVIAASVIALPLMYRNARAAFEQVNIDLIYAGRTLGMSERQIFWKIIIPEAGPGIASGTILTFARALGEYGATSMIAGYTPGRTATISTTVYQLWRTNDDALAFKWVLANLAISFVVLLTVNLLEKKQKYPKSDRPRWEEA